MTGLMLLSRVVVARKKLRNARLKEDRYRRSAENIRVSFSRCGSHNRNVSAHETAMVRHMDAADEANKLENELNLIIDEIESKLEMLTVDKGDEVLRMHFLDGVPLSKVAKEFHYNRQAIYKVKDRALKELDQILAAEEVPPSLNLGTLGECG